MHGGLSDDGTPPHEHHAPFRQGARGEPVAWAPVNALARALNHLSRVVRSGLWLLRGHRVSPTSAVRMGTRLIGKGVRVGRHSYIGPGCILMSELGARISIGECVDIGPECLVVTVTHRIGPTSRRAHGGFAQDIVIGDGTWIGSRVTILPGTRISPGTVVAAGSLLDGDYPPNVLLAGVPARVVRELPPDGDAVTREGRRQEDIEEPSGRQAP